jgi:hypothetical protein
MGEHPIRHPELHQGGADDRFLQPAAGVSPADNLVSGLVPLALLALAAYAYPKLSGGRRGALALTFGVLGLAMGLDAAYYTRETGLGGDDVSGLLALGLFGLGAKTLWDTRSHGGHRAWRYSRRLLLTAGAGARAAARASRMASAGAATRTSRPRSPT